MLSSIALALAIDALAKRVADKHLGLKAKRK